MLDLLYLGITVLFFALAVAYVAACERLRYASNEQASVCKPSRAETLMTLDYIVGLIVTAGLLVYLTYALLRPEKF